MSGLIPVLSSSLWNTLQNNKNNWYYPTSGTHILLSTPSSSILSNFLDFLGKNSAPRFLVNLGRTFQIYFWIFVVLICAYTKYRFVEDNNFMRSFHIIVWNSWFMQKFYLCVCAYILRWVFDNSVRRLRNENQKALIFGWAASYLFVYLVYIDWLNDNAILINVIVLIFFIFLLLLCLAVKVYGYCG